MSLWWPHICSYFIDTTFILWDMGQRAFFFICKISMVDLFLALEGDTRNDSGFTADSFDVHAFVQNRPYARVVHACGERW